MLYKKLLTLALLGAALFSQAQTDPKLTIPAPKPELIDTHNYGPPPYTLGIRTGAEKMGEVQPYLKGKKVALLVNQTSMVGKVHLVDTLLAAKINVVKIFSPEHGFRGNADAGEHVNNSTDAKSGLPVISVYGDKKKPTAEDLNGVDIVVFDVQDAGARFYTYLSTLHYLMEACAENKKELMVLDRPNPNGWYVDGPVLKKEFSSFVGVDPVPVVHGLTMAEYAQMINGEKWLPGGAQCKLRIVSCSRYTHATKYAVPVAPSPNLQDSLAISLYPSLCFFEGTNVSVGRGTDAPFKVIGSPDVKLDGAYTFTPVSKPGAKTPFREGKLCYGYDLRKPENRHGAGLSWQYVIDMYKLTDKKKDFFLKSGFFDKLVGTDAIRKMIEEGKSEADIKASYQDELNKYKLARKKYLLYKDF